MDRLPTDIPRIDSGRGVKQPIFEFKIDAERCGSRCPCNYPNPPLHYGQQSGRDPFLDLPAARPRGEKL